MSGGPYIQTHDSPGVAPAEGRLGPREKAIPRDAHGSRVPGWDTPADLSKDPAIIPDPATTPVPDALRAEIEDALSRYPDGRSAIIPALWAAQRLHGWCSPEAVAQVGAVLRRTPAELMAVATFYDMFETEPVGRHTVYVCTNISCSLRGADALLHRFEEESAGREDEFHVRGFECLGACDIAPMISVDGVYVGPIDADEVGAILDTIARDGAKAVLPERQIANRASTDPAVSATPTHGAAGPQAVLEPRESASASEDAVRSETDADHAEIDDVEPTEKYKSDPRYPSQPPEVDAPPDERSAEGRDPETGGATPDEVEDES